MSTHRDSRGLRSRRQDLALLAAASFLGLWFAVAAPSTSPVAAPVTTSDQADAVAEDATDNPPQVLNPVPPITDPGPDGPDGGGLGRAGRADGGRR